MKPGIVRCDAAPDDFGVDLISSLNPKMTGPLPPPLPPSRQSRGVVCQSASARESGSASISPRSKETKCNSR